MRTKGWVVFMAKRSKKLCFFSRRKLNLSVLTLLIFTFGYIIVIDVVQQHARNMHKAGYTWPSIDGRTTNSSIEATADYIQPYCTQRYRKEMSGDHHMNVGFLRHPKKNQTDQICIHPELDPCDPSIVSYDKRVPKVKCPSEENWVFVENGVFRISNWASQKYGKITCEYAPIVRGKGDYSARHAEHIKPMLDGSPLVSDFFKVACISSSGKRYHNIHAGVAYNETLHARSSQIPLPAKALGYDVFIFGFDSTSRMAWIRNLPKTREFFLNRLGGLELEGYNIVGDGTVQALLPILTGNTEHDLPSARRDDPLATEVDHFPWIWNLYKKAGYVTAWAEDMSYIGTFQMRLRGFRDQPTDHSMRTYFMLAEPMYHKFAPWCIGSEPRHLRFLNWFRDMYSMYGNKRKFMFGFHSEYSHNCNNELKKASIHIVDFIARRRITSQSSYTDLYLVSTAIIEIDDDLVELLKNLHSSGYFNQTILIFMGDHGARFTDVRSTPQGKLEERMSYFAFYFPPKFIKSHPKAIQNFKMNTKRLTTPFDIHETLHDILNFQEQRVDHTNDRGISLFKEVPKGRTCEESGVEPHWCACLEWVNVNDEATVVAVSEAVIGFINNLTLHIRELCARLQLEHVISVSRFTPNSEVLRYKKSSDQHGDHPDFSDNMTLDYDYYQVSLVTRPGDGHFEVTVKHSRNTKQLWVSEKELSRTNRYGSAPSCIADKYPNLRPYCYCS